jgi:hypothetical protein
MARCGRRSLQGELRGFAATLLFAAVAHRFFTSGLYLALVTGAAGWYAEQLMQQPRTSTASPTSAVTGKEPHLASER